MWKLCVVPETWQHWLSKPSRRETAVFTVHWCSMTGWLLRWSLKQPPVPLSGILYEKRPVTTRSRSAMWSYSEGDRWIGDSYRLTNIQAVRKQTAHTQNLQMHNCTISVLYNIQCTCALYAHYLLYSILFVSNEFYYTSKGVVV